MAGKETKRKQLHYRRATFLNETGTTLQQLLTAALERKHTVASRAEAVGDEMASPDDRYQRFINTNLTQKGMLFGNLIMYADGIAKHTVTVDLD